LRLRWKSFFDKKVAFYDAENLQALIWRLGFRRLASGRLNTTYSLGYVAKRLGFSPATRRRLSASGLARVSGRLASGREIIVFEPSKPRKGDTLSIIVPVYNEARYVRDVLAGLLRKELPIGREIIVVESASTDGSREIVRSFEGEPGLHVIYQERARGKGNAVREALGRVNGTIVLIQDADLEYDLDDYDALLEPILQRRSSFVLGSRSLGLDDWKVRQYGTSQVKGALMNLAQIMFARTFNVLYHQRTTDINTMLKVFRRECIDGCHLRGDGFDFDIELVCKIVRNGFEPLEVPVNYVARGFDEGKKINFLVDAYPSYLQLLRCRFGKL
jgi:glycosyltransferase involved in cell wall biosynthesis